MTVHNGVTNELLLVDGEASIPGIAQAGVTVLGGAVVQISGTIAGPLTIQPGGVARLTGTCSGPVRVRQGGYLEVSGTVTGPILVNDGECRVAVGAVIDGDHVTEAGELVAGHDSCSQIIPDHATRFRLHGTDAALCLRPEP